MWKLLFLLLFWRGAEVHGQIRLWLPAIEKLLEAPEDSINIGQACLSLAQEFYPEMKPYFLLRAFDSLALGFEKYFGYITDPEEKVRALNTFLYRKGPWNDSLIFAYDLTDPGAHKRDNRFINGCMARRKGSCITMPMLYVILGERLSMPIFAVRAPNHFFVRYFPKEVPRGWQANIEATSGGGYSSNEEYTVDLKIPKVGVAKGMYLRTLTKREYLASLLLINVAEYIERKSFDKAERYANLALHYDSTLATAVWARGLVHYHRAMSLAEESDRSNCLALSNEHLRVWEESKAKAKAMGMALSAPEKSFKKKAQVLKLFHKEGDN
jgi:regulator of sirC expression with transglutaminase-like and TPR domain